MKLVDTWDEWCEVYASRDSWLEEVRLVCESQGIGLRSVESTFPGTHAVFFLNEDTVLKIFCPIRHNSYRKELRLHNGPLAGNGLFPQVRFRGKSPSGYDYIAFTRLNGKPVREVGREAISADAMRDLARAIADLQSRTLERADDALRCLVHCDLTQDHVFLGSDGKLEGIIDFGDARMGHPADEFPVLFVACFECDDPLIAEFRKAYDVKADHYHITDEDLVEALRRHTYCRDMIADLRRLDTRFAGEMLDRLR